MEEDLRTLFAAASNNRKNRVKKLCRKQVNLNYVSDLGENALNLAVGNNHKEIVKYLVKKGALLYNERTRPSTLILAIQRGLKDMVKLLLDLGADVQEGKDEQRTRVLPLSCAAGCLQYEIVELLIQKKADVHAVNPETNRTALHEVASGCSSISFLLSGETKSKTAMLKVARLLIQNGANLNAEDKQDQTPLDAAISNNIELSKMLIREGARVRREKPDGSIVNILHQALKYHDDHTLVEYCLQSGSGFTGPRPGNKALCFAYHYALLYNSAEVIRTFWAFGCPFDLPDHDGTDMSQLQLLPVLDPTGTRFIPTEKELRKNSQYYAQMALYDGIKANDYVLVASAVGKGALAKGTFMEYPSPLHHVAANKLHHKIAHILLEKGSPVNKLDSAQKKTTLFFALITGNPDMTKEILKYGGCFTKKDLEMRTHIKDKEVQTILQEITKAFNFTRKGSNKVLKQIEQFLSAGNKDMALVLMNCVDWRGRSLLNLASEKGHSKLTQRLMKLRITHFC